MTTAPASEPLLTAEEFYHLPDPPHGGKMELLSGKVIEHMPPGGVHGKLTRRLGTAVGAFADANGLGETVTDSGFRLGREPDTVLGPDVAVVAWTLLCREHPATNCPRRRRASGRCGSEIGP